MSFTETVFMTGFPGFIAERLVARLARADTQFYLLVQKQFIDDAMQSLVKIADETGTPPENFAIVEGDISKPGLGVSAADYSVLIDETNTIYHLAAVYDLEVEKDLAYKVNLDGTKNVNEFARTVRNLRRYNYISTCYVAGRREGRILESELEHDAGFRNYYEETKYLAETTVEGLKEELPVTIFRPSVVVGDSRTGETSKYDGIYSLIRYLNRAPWLFRFVNVGNDKVKLNLVPVDFVVEGIARLGGDAASVGRTIALADPNPLSTAELFDAIAESMTGRHSIVRPSAEMVEKSLMFGITPTLTGLPHSAVPYFFIEQEYDTEIAEELLGPYGITCPNFRDYVVNLIRFVRANPIL